MKKYILILIISLIIYLISNYVFYYCVGDIVDWTVSALCWLSAIGIYETFHGGE